MEMYLNLTHNSRTRGGTSNQTLVRVSRRLMSTFAYEVTTFTLSTYFVLSFAIPPPKSKVGGY